MLPENFTTPLITDGTRVALLQIPTHVPTVRGQFACAGPGEPPVDSDLQLNTDER